MVEEVDLARPDRALPFTAVDAIAAIRSGGVFVFQVAAPELEQEQCRLLEAYRSNFTVPIFSDAPDGLTLLGTGTLFEHEGRRFLVTADHIFRTDENDPDSPRIDMATVAVPAGSRAEGTPPADITTLGRIDIFRHPPPVLVDVIVIELLSPETIATLQAGWTFLSFSQAEDPAAADTGFLITGFLLEGLRYDAVAHVVVQAPLAFESCYLHYVPPVRDPVPALDLFFYLQPDLAYVNGTRRTVTTLKGLSGGPIWALRNIAEDEFWTPSKAMKIVAVQSSEFQSRESWARGFRWASVLEILRHPAVAFRDPP